jgi:hypothetical protein
MDVTVHTKKQSIVEMFLIKQVVRSLIAAQRFTPDTGATFYVHPTTPSVTKHLICCQTTPLEQKQVLGDSRCVSETASRPLEATHHCQYLAGNAGWHQLLPIIFRHKVDGAIHWKQDWIRSRQFISYSFLSECKVDFLALELHGIHFLCLTPSFLELIHVHRCT